MANELAKLFVTLGLDDRELQKNLKQIQKKMGAWGKNMAIAGGAMVAGVAAVSTASLKMAADYDSAMREVNTMMQLGEAEFKDFSGSVREMASAMGVDAVESAKAMYQAISAGVPKENAVDFLRVATKAAIGGVTDTATAVDGLTTILNAFKMPVNEAEKVADLMFTTVKGGKTTFQELSDALFNVAPIAKASGVSIDEVTAALATMTKQGIPTSVATTQLRAAIQSMTAPTIRQEKYLKELGLEMSKTHMETEGLAVVMQELVDATGGDMAMLRKLIGSVEGVQAVLSLAGENADIFAADLDAMADSAGNAEAAFQQMEKSTTRQMEKLKTSFQDMAISIGTALMPVLEQVIKYVKPIIEKIGQWISDNPELTKTILLVAGAVGGLLLFLGTLGMMIGPIAAVLGILFGPVGIILAGVAAVTALWLAWKNNWGNIRGVTETVVEAIVHAVGWLWDKILAYFQRIAEGVAWVMKGIANVIGIFAPEWAESVRNAADSMIDAFVGFRTRTVNALKGFDADFQKVTHSFDWMVTAVEGGASDIKGNLEEIGDAAGDMAEEASDAFETMTGAMEKSLSALEIMQNSLYSIFGVGSPLPAGVGGEPFSSGNWFPTGTGWINPEQHPHLFSPTGLPWSEYDEGGVIPGAPGSPLPVIAHGGETVFTPGQLGDLVTVLNKLADGSIRGNAPVHLQLQLGERTIFDDFLDYAGEKYSQESHFRGRG